jgi:hypothetical protein
MEKAMSAEWAAVLVGAFGVLATVAIAVGGPAWKRLEKRKQAALARLGIVTSRWMPNGLRPEFHYAPEFMHQAVNVQVAIKTQSVRLIPGRPAMNPAPMVTGGYVGLEQVTLRRKQFAPKARPLFGRSTMPNFNH